MSTRSRPPENAPVPRAAACDPVAAPVAVPNETASLYPAGCLAVRAQGESMSRREWPLRSHLELAALPTAVPCARLHATNVLWEWGMDALSDTVELLVSEIITNAVQASGRAGSGPFGGEAVPTLRLWLASDRSVVLVQVWDASPQMPVRQNPEPDAVSGRGIMLVEHLSAEWGSFVPDGYRGKVVWAVVAAP